jgi:hypothetical protein
LGPTSGHIETYPFLATPDIVFFTDIVPNMVPMLQTTSQYTDIGTKKQNIVADVLAIFRCRVFSDTGAFYMISGTINHLLRFRPPAAALARRSNRSSLCPGAPTGTQHCRVQQPSRNVEFSSLLRLLLLWRPGPVRPGCPAGRSRWAVCNTGYLVMIHNDST